MMHLIIGFILGVIVSAAVINPNDAKQIANKAIDQAHSTFENASKPTTTTTTTVVTPGRNLSDADIAELAKAVAKQQEK